MKVFLKLNFVLLFSIFSLSACSEKATENSKATYSVNASVADLILINAKVYSLNWDEPDSLGKPAANAP